MIDQAFITGCDSNTEWMVPWFLKNFKKHNKMPILFCDFGVTPEFKEWLRISDFDDTYEVPKQRTGGWFYKPVALLKAPAREKVWLDTDMHILGDISGAFNYIEQGKLAMVEDKPWTLRMKEKWHNSGLVGVRSTPPILLDWMEACRENPVQGDQEVLHSMIRGDALTRMRYISDVPNIYNWLRLQVTHDNQDSKDKLIMHWTGKKGKDQIRKIMYNE
jgi:hypothetical protein